ncbi:MAG: hypothetical protein J6B17_02390 [Ruminococcus sp.]|nr:hypothetical protein [Ruminococcus sp.]
MKTKIKKQLTQTIAVAAAAVCAVTATFAGVTINHADAAESIGNAYIYFAGGNCNRWEVEGEFANVSAVEDAVITGDGQYTVSVTLEGGTATFNFLSVQTNLGSGVYNDLEFTVDSIAVAGEAVTIDSTPVSDQWGGSDGWRCTVINDWTNAVPLTVANGETLSITFTLTGTGVEQGEDTTTTTTETTTTTIETTTTTTETTTTAPDTTESSETTTTESDVTESSETTTTTTTTEPDTTESSETTSTTEKTESSASETTTTTKETTATTTTTTATTTTPKATTTTTTTTPKATTTTSVTLETSIDFVQEKEKGDNGSYHAFVEFDPKGADRVKVVFKVSSSDTEATVSYGCWNNELNDWFPNDQKVNVPTNKIVSYTDEVPAQIETTMKISIYWPTADYVTIQSVTLIYDKAPVVTTTTEFESDLTFETVTIGEANNKIDMLDRCYIIETIKADPGYNIKGGMYSGVKGDTYYTYDEWEATVDESQIIVKEYEIRGAYDASYGIFYYGKGTEKRNSVEVNIQTFYTGDASMNGKVNGSDVRAIVNYLISEEKTNAQDVICDYDDDGEVELTDAVALTKALLSPAKTKALVS